MIKMLLLCACHRTNRIPMHGHSFWQSPHTHRLVSRFFIEYFLFRVYYFEWIDNNFRIRQRHFITKNGPRLTGVRKRCSVCGVGWIHLVRRPLVSLLYQPRMTDEYSAPGGMRIVRGKWNTRRNPVTVPPYPSEIPYDLIWGRTRAADVGSRWLTAWAI
jgi:hypothetical protein